MSTLGIVTIGQAPRSDVVPQMRRYLPDATHIVEAGALDGLSFDDVQELRPHAGEYVLTTRMSDGRSVIVAKERLIPRLEAAVERVAEAGASPILILCTGQFPELRRRPVLVAESDWMLRHVVLAFRPERLGVLIPLREQVEPATDRWSVSVPEVHVVAADPYGDAERISAAGREIRDSKPELIVLDCVGFKVNHRRVVREAAGVPVVLANVAVSRLLAEVL
jgi:protein AroM